MNKSAPPPPSKIPNLVDDALEITDPNPDIHELYISFDLQFFSGTLARRACTVAWSKRMTSCAGVCQFYRKTGLCCVRLSEPLLKLRRRRDLVETLLHEMIHAYLFLTGGFMFMDRDGHGPEFQSHMHRINSVAGTSITIFHSFHAEVSHYKQHWWRCTGPCVDQAPFYGWVKRSMNRNPGPNDFWWAQHQITCGGAFVKVKEPEKSSTTTQKKPTKARKEGNGCERKRKGPLKNSGNTSQQPRIDRIFPMEKKIDYVDLVDATPSHSNKKVDFIDLAAVHAADRFNNKNQSENIDKKFDEEEDEICIVSEVIRSGSAHFPDVFTSSSSSLGICISGRSSIAKTTKGGEAKKFPGKGYLLVGGTSADF